MNTANLFTPAEQKVLRVLRTEWTYKQIASVLGVSTSTAKTHVLNIASKMGVDTKAEVLILVKTTKLKEDT